MEEKIKTRSVQHSPTTFKRVEEKRFGLKVIFLSAPSLFFPCCSFKNMKQTKEKEKRAKKKKGAGNCQREREKEKKKKARRLFAAL
jgi:peroxiredoxin